MNLDALGLAGGVGRVVVLAQHLHVPAQGNNANPVFRLAPLLLEQGLGEGQRTYFDGDIETDVELLTLHAAGLGDQEVAQFVDEDHQPQAKRSLEYGQPKTRLQPTGQGSYQVQTHFETS